MLQRKTPPPTTGEDLPPLLDAEHWWCVIGDGKLRSYRAGALLALYDARDPATDPRLANAIVAHVLLVARKLAAKFMPSDMRSRHDAIGDVVGMVAEAITDPSKQSLRRYFANYIRFRCLDLNGDRNEENEEQAAAIAAHPDPEGRAIQAIDLRNMLSRIQDLERRKTVEMLLDGWNQKDIATALRRHRTTVGTWIRQTDVVFVEELRLL